MNPLDYGDNYANPFKKNINKRKTMEIDFNEYIDLAIFWGMRIISAVLILIAGWIIGSWVRRRIFNIKKLEGFTKQTYCAASISSLYIIGVYYF